MNEQARLRVLVSLVGDAGVGKASLVHRFLPDADVQRDVEEGRTSHRKRYLLSPPERNLAVSMQLDISSPCHEEATVSPQECTRMSDADGVVAVADLTRRETLDALDDWVDAVYRAAGDVPVVLALNKTDLRGEEDPTDWDRETRAVAYAFDAPHFLTGTKTGENVPAVFERMAVEVLRSKLRQDEVEGAATRPLLSG